MSNKYQSKIKLREFRDELLAVLNKFPDCGICFRPDGNTFEIYLWDDNDDYSVELEEGTTLSPQKLAHW